jgi:hypothetical protein
MTLWQSLAIRHGLPGPQATQVPPPQSIVVSFPFHTPSVHVGATHLPLAHLLLRQSQSDATPHVRPTGQRAQLPPPQSTSDSVPFLTPSLHVAALQNPAVHTLFEQSLAVVHALPAPHAAQPAPPQSTSDSVPFLRPSVQPFGWQVPEHSRL